ncbi:phosphoribosylglycinamide formyltransferase, partial [Klebsiella pneumoniae]|nr:phosphoribosylglycinamide formyltransferase [Klebsiella pneumoniae]
MPSETTKQRFRWHPFQKRTIMKNIVIL